MSKVLITGGAGYVGSVLVPKVLDKGYGVRVLDLMLFGEKGLENVKDRCEIVQGSITDSKLVKKSLEGVDYVIHLASIANDPCCDLNPQLTEKVNYEATKNLVLTAKESGIKRFIFASSGSVYGIQKEKRITEDWPVNPQTIYADTKARAEKIIREQNDKNFVTTILRAATTAGYSPRMRLDLAVNIFTEQAINRGWLSVHGGSQMRPSIDVRDITDYYTFMLDAPAEKISGETFNASNDNYSVLEIANIVKDVVGKNVEVKIEPVVDTRNYPMVSEKITNVLGLKPKYGVKESVENLKDAFERGLIPNPSDVIYRNIETMKRIPNLQF
ncbi:NAD-dependent glucose-6-phosphate dehydrogenase [uncultured archaeon]|nr:NAD-dependent glucose-6-phosphate dehydrogenase [uncultured archaeon]